jgi:glucose/arabinose dehydrogenase
MTVTKNKATLLMTFILLLLMVKGVSCAPAKDMKGVHLGDITLPPGFSIDIYADDVENARSLALGDNGTLFVGTRSAGKVYAVLDRNHDARADQVITIARGLDMPNGVAFRKGSLYVAEVNRVLRYDRIESRLKNPPKPVTVTDRSLWHKEFFRFISLFFRSFLSDARL